MAWTVSPAAAVLVYFLANWGYLQTEGHREKFGPLLATAVVAAYFGSAVSGLAVVLMVARFRLRPSAPRVTAMFAAVCGALAAPIGLMASTDPISIAVLAFVAMIGGLLVSMTYCLIVGMHWR